MTQQTENALPAPPEKKESLITGAWRSGQLLGFIALLYNMHVNHIETIQHITETKDKIDNAILKEGGHESQDADAHKALWTKIGEMDNRIYLMNGKKNK